MTPSASSRASRTFATAAFVWAAVGALIALWALPDVNDDARLLVGVAAIVFPGFALLAGVLALRGRWRLAGGVLALSAGTPTFFLWVPNLVALVVGIGVAVHPPSNMTARVPVTDGPAVTA